VCITTYQQDTEYNPDPTTKQHAVVNIQLNIVTCPVHMHMNSYTRHVVAVCVRL